MENHDFYQIPTNLEKIWLFKYIVQTVYQDPECSRYQPKYDEVYGFCIGPNYKSAVAYLESYYGDELNAIRCLEAINCVTPVARSYNDWNDIAESLSWESDKLEEYIG